MDESKSIDEGWPKKARTENTSARNLKKRAASISSASGLLHALRGGSKVQHP